MEMNEMTAGARYDGNHHRSYPQPRPDAEEHGMDGPERALHANGHQDGDPTPKKRTRGKYASRACAICRQRKLKCDGQEPCHRCARRNHRCVYSDDRAVNEILRRTRQQLVSGGTNGAMPIETRVQRLEAAMRAVTERLDVGQSGDFDHQDQNGDPEPETVPAEQANSFQGDTAFRSPVNAFHENLSQIKQSMGINGDLASSTADSPNSVRASRPSEKAMSIRREHSTAQIRIGAKSLPFPTASEYEEYLHYVFDDINACHPCLNEPDFRARSTSILRASPMDRRESCFLALHYILFACVDILRDISGPDDSTPSPGWRWYQAADELIGKTKFHGIGDLSLIQYLNFEAFYLTHSDRPNAAYNISGLACRLCYQFGLHQQSRWEQDQDSYNAHMKQRILWTTYFVDRRISLSCGRPFGMNDSDIAVHTPAYVDDKELRPNAQLPHENLERSFLPYMTCMIAFARFSGEIWERLFSASADNNGAEEVAVLDTRIAYWTQNVLPTIPLLPPTRQPTVRHIRQHILVHTRIAHLRLLLRRRLMVSLTYTTHDGRICGDLAIDIVRMISQRSGEAAEASSFRFHMTISLSGALLILGTLLCRRLSDLGLQENYPAYAEAFRQGLAILRELGTGLSAARRVLDDLKETISFVETLIDQPAPTPQQPLMRMPSNVENLFPYSHVDFNQQAGTGSELDAMPTNDMQHDVEFSGQDMGFNLFDGSFTPRQQQNNGYGVPWI